MFSSWDVQAAAEHAFVGFGTSNPPNPQDKKVILTFIVNDRSWGFGTSNPEPFDF